MNQTLSSCHQLRCVKLSGFDSLLPKKKKQLGPKRRRFGLAVTAQLSGSLSINIGLDSEVFQVFPVYSYFLYMIVINGF